MHIVKSLSMLFQKQKQKLKEIKRDDLVHRSPHLISPTVCLCTISTSLAPIPAKDTLPPPTSLHAASRTLWMPLPFVGHGTVICQLPSPPQFSYVKIERNRKLLCWLPSSSSLHSVSATVYKQHPAIPPPIINSKPICSLQSPTGRCF